MSAPPLPEIFGNYVLGEFNEVVAPTAISWLPQTIGWLWVALGLLGLASYKGWKWLRHWHRNRYRGEALALLCELSSQPERVTHVAEINRVLKRTALAAFPREQVAHLSGTPWVNFLNRQCEQALFEGRCEILLAEGSYRTEIIDASAIGKLTASCQSWVQLHVNTDDV